MLFGETVAVYCEKNTQIYFQIIKIFSSYLTRNSSATETNQLMLSRETVAVYCENQTDHKSSQAYVYYDRRSVGQSILVSGTHHGPAIKIFPSFFKYCIYFNYFEETHSGSPLE
jgi:hypothetical protein